MTKKVLIIGGNAVGLTAAVNLRKKNPNFDITVLEQSEFISISNCSLPYLISKEIKDYKLLIKRDLQYFENLNISILLNHKVINVSNKNKKVFVINNLGNELSLIYDKLIIASGAIPYKPEFYVNYEDIYFLNSLKDVQKFLQNEKKYNSIAIIGAGFKAIEYAESLVKINKKIVIFEKNKNLLENFFNKNISEIIYKELENLGIKIILNSDIKKIDKINENYSINNKEDFSYYDAVIFQTGILPNTEFLNKKEFSLHTNNGLIVNKSLQTNQPEVFAGGDCVVLKDILSKKISYYPYGRNANIHGKIIADNISGFSSKIDKVFDSACTVINNKLIAYAGLTGKNAKFSNLYLETLESKISNFINEDYVINLYYDKNKVIKGIEYFGSIHGNSSIQMAIIAIENNLKLNNIIFSNIPYTPKLNYVWNPISILARKILAKEK